MCVCLCMYLWLYMCVLCVWWMIVWGSIITLGLGDEYGRRQHRPGPCEGHRRLWQNQESLAGLSLKGPCCRSTKSPILILHIRSRSTFKLPIVSEERFSTSLGVGEETSEAKDNECGTVGDETHPISSIRESSIDRGSPALTWNQLSTDIDFSARAYIRNFESATRSFVSKLWRSRKGRIAWRHREDFVGVHGAVLESRQWGVGIERNFGTK